MATPIVDVFAFQEALLIEAVFGVVILTMLWVGFRRWLQHKERMGRLIAEQNAAHLARVEERLEAVEQIVSDGVHTAAQIEAPPPASRPWAGDLPSRQFMRR